MKDTMKKAEYILLTLRPPTLAAVRSIGRPIFASSRVPGYQGGGHQSDVTCM